MTDSASLREELRRILNVKIYPRENIDPLEAVTNYLLDNDVVPVVRCRDCKHCECLIWDSRRGEEYTCNLGRAAFVQPNDYCSYGERKGGKSDDNG